MDSPRLRTDIAGYAFGAARCGLVALSGARLTGFAAASWLRDEAAAEVEGLVVEREHRRQGIGAALISACMAWAAGAGASAIRLEVRASNVAALALYSRLGFSTAGVRRALLLDSRWKMRCYCEAPAPRHL